MGKTIDQQSVNTPQTLRDKKYQSILTRADIDVGGHLPYLGGLMIGALSKHKKFDTKFKKQVQGFPATHSITVLEGFYESLYNSREGIIVLDPTLKLTNPNLDLKGFKSEAAKIKALKAAIEKGIEELQGPLQDTTTKQFVEQFKKQYTKFNQNLEHMNQALSKDSVAEAKRLAKMYLAPRILDSLYLKDSNNMPLITDKDEKRKIFDKILPKMIIPEKVFNECTQNQAIMENGIIAYLLEPLLDQKFKNNKGGHDLTKLKDPNIQEEFINEANQILPKLLDIMPPLNNAKKLLKSGDYKVIGIQYLHQAATANPQELKKISNKIELHIAAISAVEKSDLTLSLAKQNEMIDVLVKRMDNMPELNQKMLKKLTDDLSKGLNKLPRSSTPGSIEDNVKSQDLQNLADSLVNKYTKLGTAEHKVPPKTKPSASKSKTKSFINVITGYGDLTGMAKVSQNNPSPALQPSTETLSSSTSSPKNTNNKAVSDNQTQNITSTKKQETLASPPPLPPVKPQVSDQVKAQTQNITSTKKQETLAPPPPLPPVKPQVSGQVKAQTQASVQKPKAIIPSNSPASTIQQRPLPVKPQRPAPKAPQANTTTRSLPPVPPGDTSPTLDGANVPSKMRKILQNNTKTFNTLQGQLDGAITQKTSTTPPPLPYKPPNKNRTFP